MADERRMVFGLFFDSSDANDSIDESKKKQKELEQKIEQTNDELEQMGANLGQIGQRGVRTFNSVQGAGVRMGTTVGNAMLQSIKRGDTLAKTIKTGLGTAFQAGLTKAKAFGKGTQSIFQDIGRAIAHPAQTIKATLGGALNEARRDMDGVGKSADKAGDKLDNMAKRGSSSAAGLVGSIKKVVAALAIVATVAAGINAIKDFSVAAVNAAANAEEVQSKFEVVFKDTAAKSETWITNFADAAKRSKVEVKGFMADAQAMFTGIGMAIEPASEMSAAMTSLSYDLASFHNISDQDAFAKVRSGLLGETEGLKSMGIVLNDTALKQSMMTMGIKANFNELDEATKMQVRWNAILAQTGDAQTDVTRSSGSYTNGLKGIQGLWQDFLAEAGAKFLPVLTSLFDTIIEAWPTIEPMLMGLVGLLTDGLSQAMPVITALAMQLIPIFVQVIGQIFTAVSPLIPVFLQLIQTLLPPLAQIIGLLVSTLLPPIATILDAVMQLLQPIMPILVQIVGAILPPLGQLLAAISPLITALSPVLEFVGQILTVIANVLGKIIGWIADGIGKVGSFLGDLIGGTKKATDSTAELAGNLSTLQSPAIEAGFTMPDVQPVDMTAFTTSVQSGVNTLPAANSSAWNQVQTDTGKYTQAIGTTASDTYLSIAKDSDSTWERMASAAELGVSKIVAEFKRLKNAADQIGHITITAQGVDSKELPRYANGTKHHPGGPAIINDGGGGELAVLPDGTEVIPADQTDRLITNKSSKKTVVFNPAFEITLNGSASDQDKQSLKDLIRDTVRKEYERIKDGELSEQDLEYAF